MFARSLVVALMFAACTPHHIMHGDAGIDMGLASEDAAMDLDAFTAIDAFVPPPIDGGHDASIVLIDGGSDAGSDGGHDASSGCTALPTGAAIVIHGTIGASPTFDRQIDACGGESTVGTAVGYTTHVLCNAGATRSFTFELDAAAADGITDPFVVIDRGMGDVSTLTCLASDDDSAGMPNSLAVATVDAGATITVVATTYDNDDTGAYVLTIAPM